MTQNMRGTIKWYHASKHIGFLVAENDNREVFIHINDCDGFTPETGMAVEFELGLDRQGRSKAIRIKRVAYEGIVLALPVEASERCLKRN